jgi:TrmH family RNA methyltransferase
LILDGLQNPGNMASIVRTAEAAGAAGIVTTPGTVRLTSAKALRAAMGSSLRFPCLEHVPVEQINDNLSHGGYKLYGTLADAETKIKSSLTCWEVNWTNACAVVLGQEGGGLPASWGMILHDTIVIPMQGKVESLNVAAAAAVILYEAFRQRTAHA